MEVVHGPVDHDLATLAPLLRPACAWIAGVAPVRADHLELAPALQIVARYGTGTDAVDLDAARRRGVTVTNTPGANAEAVADHTLALVLAVLRRVVDGDHAVRSGESPRLVGRELSSLEVGLVGFGAVGRAVARRMTALGSRVHVADPALTADVAARSGVTLTTLDDIVARCDVVSLHLPGDGRPVLDASRIERLRPDAVVINTARASLVDEEALASALAEKRVGGAGLDVLSAPDSPLGDAPRTVLTPHVAGQTTEAVDRMGTMAVEEVLRVLAGEQPRHRVDVSEHDVEPDEPEDEPDGRRA